MNLTTSYTLKLLFQRETLTRTPSKPYMSLILTLTTLHRSAILTLILTCTKNRISILAGRYQDGIVVKSHFYKTASAKSGGTKATGSKLSGHMKYLEHRPKDEQ